MKNNRETQLFLNTPTPFIYNKRRKHVESILNILRQDFRGKGSDEKL